MVVSGFSACHYGDWRNAKMREFEISPDCMLEKSSRAIAKELMKGTFVIGCDYKNNQLVLLYMTNTVEA